MQDEKEGETPLKLVETMSDPSYDEMGDMAPLRGVEVDSRIVDLLLNVRDGACVFQRFPIPGNEGREVYRGYERAANYQLIDCGSDCVRIGQVRRWRTKHADVRYGQRHFWRFS